jgi:two-component system, sensor histidine kinase and response regulator
LRESERQLREMLETVQLAAVTLDANGAILFCNDFLLQLTGWRRVEVDGKSWFDLFTPQELDLRKVFLSYLEKGTVIPHYENEIVTKAGERRMIAWSNTLLKDASGKVIGTTSIGEDITDRFKLEDALRQSQQTLRALVDSNPESLCLMDHDGKILVANRSFAHRLNRDPDDIVNSNVYKLIPAELAKERKEKFNKVFDTATPVRFSDQHGLLIFDHHVHPAQTKDGKVLTVAVLSIDVTEQHMASLQLKRLNEELEGRVTERTQELTKLNEELKELKEVADHASKAKSDYLASMSHEIRTPINAIIGLGHLLLQEKLSPKQRDYLQKIDNATNSLLDLINDILDLSKIESGKLTLENTNFSLRDTVAQALDIVSTEAQQKGLKLLNSIDEKVPDLLHGDQIRLRQVMLNLLNNAVKFTNTGQAGISIVMGAKGNDPEKVGLTITVSDTGIGMTQEQISKLFSPFVQAERSTTRTHGGTGLGLSICKQLVTMMGGSIEASSVHGKWSKFTVKLEIGICTDKSPAATIKESLSPGQRHKVLTGARILVVEDDPINQLVVKEILSSAGVRVAIASDGAEALAAVENRAVNRIDAILVDILLPDMDGYELTKRIKAINGADRIPVIAVTAHAMSGDRERSLAAGMNAHISKPIQIEQLYITLSELLAARIREESRVVESDDLLFYDDSELPRIPGIAIGSALGRLNGNKQLLAQLIKLFAREHRSIPEEIDQLLKEGDLATAQRLVHSLKGVAGNLSAERLYTSSSKLDSAIRAGQKNEAMDSFRDFQLAMNELCDTAGRIEALLGVTLDQQVSVTSLPPSDLLQIAMKLKGLLQAQDLGAAAVSEHLKGLASSGKFSSMVNTVDDEVKCLNYREALKHLAKLISMLEAPVMEGE